MTSHELDSVGSPGLTLLGGAKTPTRHRRHVRSSPSLPLILLLLLQLLSPVHSLSIIIMPRPGSNKRWCCITSVCLTSVAYIRVHRASGTACHPASLRHRHSAPSGAGWRHIFSLFPSPYSPVLNLRCRVFFCNVDWCTVFLKFFYLTTL